MTFDGEQLKVETAAFSFLDRKVIISGYKGDYIFEDISSNQRFYEEDLLNFLAHIELDGSQILDVGANLGNHTVSFAITHPDSLLVSIEPFAENLKVLKTNIEQNGLSDRTTIIEAAAGDSSDNLQISQIDATNLGAISVNKVEPTDAKRAVRQIRLDELSADRNVGLIKIDVEGFEANVIQGALELIKRDRPVITTEAHSWREYRAIAGLLSDYCYVPIAIRGRSYNYIWASVGKTLSESQFDQIARLAEVLERRESRGQILKRLNKIESRINTTIIPN